MFRCFRDDMQHETPNEKNAFTEAVRAALDSGHGTATLWVIHLTEKCIPRLLQSSSTYPPPPLHSPTPCGVDAKGRGGTREEMGGPPAAFQESGSELRVFFPSSPQTERIPFPPSQGSVLKCYKPSAGGKKRGEER